MHQTALLTRLLRHSPGGAVLPADPHVTRWFAVRLDEGETEEVPPAVGRMVLHCRSGALWITHDGDPRDVILGVNESYRVDRADRMTVHALLGSGLEIEVGAA
jgi:hypothetical protein